MTQASQHHSTALSEATRRNTVRLTAPWGRLAAELARFLGVGAIATVLTVGLFNFLVHWGPAPLSATPVTAYAIAFAAGTAVAFVGNRFWTFSHRQSAHQARELASFVVLNSVGLGIPVLTLAVSRHLLGLHSFWADNISANGVGLVLATAFRFWAYRRWVFVGRREER